MVSDSNKKRISKMIKLCNELIHKCENKTYDDLIRDENFAEASCFVLGQIGEQVPTVKILNDGTTIRENDYDEFYEKFSSINWNEIKGARNKIYHDYDGVNMKIIWDTLQDIPSFRNKLIQIEKEF